MPGGQIQPIAAVRPRAVNFPAIGSTVQVSQTGISQDPENSPHPPALRPVPPAGIGPGFPYSPGLRPAFLAAILSASSIAFCARLCLDSGLW